MRDLMLRPRRGQVVPRNIDSVFDELRNTILGPSTYDWFFGDPFNRMQKKLFPDAIVPKTNFGETPEAYHAEFMLAGFTKEDIDISVDEHSVTIKAEHSEDEDTESEDIKYYDQEISTKRFAIKRTFPTAIDTKNITAEHKDGILICVFPKKEADEKKPLKIDIK